MNTLNTILKKITPVKTELSSEKVELSLVNDADKIYASLVKGTQRQVSILKKVEAELKKLEADAKRLQKLEQTIEKQAKELGVDIDQVILDDYAASTWVSDLNKYSNEIGSIASVL